MKSTMIKVEPEKTEPQTNLRLLLSAAIVECDGGLLRADSSQIQFNATRLYLRGRREALAAVLDYLDGKPDALDALTRP